MTDQILQDDVTKFVELNAAKAQFNPLPEALAAELQEVSTRLLAAGYTLDPFAAPAAADAPLPEAAAVTAAKELVHEAGEFVHEFIDRAQGLITEAEEKVEELVEGKPEAPSADASTDAATVGAESAAAAEQTASQPESATDPDTAPNLISVTVAASPQSHIIGVNGKLTTVAPGDQMVSPEEYEVLKNAGLLVL